MSRPSGARRAPRAVRALVVGAAAIGGFTNKPTGDDLTHPLRPAKHAVASAGVAGPAVAAGTDTSLFDGDPGLPTATLRIAPRAAWMFDYYPMRVLTELPDGSCEAAMTYASEEWMSRLLLGFGSEVTVLAPAELADRMRTAAAAALEAYGER